MHEIELLRVIRPLWIQRALQLLARGSSLREGLGNQLEQFYDLFDQVIETGDPGWLEGILSNWANSLTQTDLEDSPSSLTQFINELMTLTFNVCMETLDDAQSMQLMRALLPVFSFSFEKAAQFEIEARISYVSKQLYEIQQNLERLDRSKSDFIAVAAHELKTPLTLVEGYAAMLRENMENGVPNPYGALLINGIHNGTRRLQDIIDDMIDVSLIDNNLLKLNFQPIWINRLFTILQTELEETSKERNLTLLINEFPGHNELIFADPERLLQVFRNILINAVKFTPDGGKISINGRKLPGFVEVTIEDTGIGIAPADQTIIFEKFSRLGNISLHSSGKTKFKGGGPGLGLHIARGVIEAHGGAIWVESAGYDEITCPGSRFHILLPARNEPPDQKMAKLFKPLMDD